MFIAPPRTFKSPTGRPVVRHQEPVPEPSSGEAYTREPIALVDTPVGTPGTQFVASQISGPTNSRVDISLDGGTTWHNPAAAPLAEGGMAGVERTVLARGVVTPGDGVTNRAAIHMLGIEESGEGDYDG